MPRHHRSGRPSAPIVCLLMSLSSWPVTAADLFDPRVVPDDLPLAPRYFPRGDGSDSFYPAVPGRISAPGCIPRRALVPTNAPNDPSYVGSEYGLSKPSYYGFTPPRGVDDPYGRPLRPHCR